MNVKIMKKIILCKKIVTVNQQNEIYDDFAIVLEGNNISNILPISEVDFNEKEIQIFDYKNLVVTPGFIQTHIHLCQTMFRGLAEDMVLLDWLQKRIFPFENAHSYNSLKASAEMGIIELLKTGTTTVLDMGTLNYQEAVLDSMIDAGIRGYTGKCLIDENSLYESFKESKADNLLKVKELITGYHNKNGRVKYAVSPRFVLSCSEELLRESYDILNQYSDVLYHTHSSENLDEIRAVKQKTGMENIEYFDSIGVLSDRTILAHCIHLNEKEKELLANKKVRVAHCPATNMKLASGFADIPDLKQRGIVVSIGSDGPPCNNNLNIIDEIRLAGLIQKPKYGPTSMDAKILLRMATIDGAKALGLDNEVGSIEIGKKADLVFFDLNNVENGLDISGDKVNSSLIYGSNISNIKNVMIDGELVVENSNILNYDENEIYMKAKDELKNLLKRI